MPLEFEMGEAHPADVWRGFYFRERRNSVQHGPTPSVIVQVFLEVQELISPRCGLVAWLRDSKIKTPPIVWRGRPLFRRFSGHMVSQSNHLAVFPGW